MRQSAIKTVENWLAFAVHRPDELIGTQATLAPVSVDEFLDEGLFLLVGDRSARACGEDI